MSYQLTERRRTWSPVVQFAIMSLLVTGIGAFRHYSFLPQGDGDGFLQQIHYVIDLLHSGNFQAIFSDSLSVIHLWRLILVAPFLQMELMVGGIGSLLLLEVLLWPLLWSFRGERSGPVGYLFTALRVATLLLPLAVSGRTVLVVLGMGYLLLGMIKHPFNFGFMLVGSLVSLLSSASVLFTLAVLLLADNRADRARGFYVSKGVLFILLAGLFIPSLAAKANGFVAGASGYQATTIDAPTDANEPKETGAVAGVTRLLNRSTLIVSVQENNWLRSILYLALSGAALAFVGWHLWKRQGHPLLVPLAILSTGILLEGLALWPIFMPLLWAYTGRMGPQQTVQSVSLSEQYTKMTRWMRGAIYRRIS